MIEGTEAGKCFKLGQVTEAEETQKGGISPHPTGTERRRGGGETAKVTRTDAPNETRDTPDGAR